MGFLGLADEAELVALRLRVDALEQANLKQAAETDELRKAVNDMQAKPAA